MCKPCSDPELCATPPVSEGAPSHIASLRVALPSLHSLQPPLSTVLGPHIASGVVEYHWFAGVPQPTLPATERKEVDAAELGAGAAAPVPADVAADFTYRNFTLFQLYAYDWCLQRHRHDHTWMGALPLPPGVAGHATALNSRRAYASFECTTVNAAEL